MNTRTMKYQLTPIAALLAALPLMAQPTTDDALRLQTVEVTASKRSQMLIDVPYSITAIGAGTAPSSRTAASHRFAASTLWGYGSPCASGCYL